MFYIVSWGTSSPDAAWAGPSRASRAPSILYNRALRAGGRRISKIFEDFMKFFYPLRFLRALYEHGPPTFLPPTPVSTLLRESVQLTLVTRLVQILRYTGRKQGGCSGLEFKEALQLKIIG